eukprot:3377854-Alexandrium_andersonii.AAC.1
MSGKKDLLPAGTRSHLRAGVAGESEGVLRLGALPRPRGVLRERQRLRGSGGGARLRDHSRARR